MQHDLIGDRLGRKYLNVVSERPDRVGAQVVANLRKNFFSGKHASLQ